MKLKFDAIKWHFLVQVCTCFFLSYQSFSSVKNKKIKDQKENENQIYIELKLIKTYNKVHLQTENLTKVTLADHIFLCRIYL